MNILVIGKGGREHALIKALQNSKTSVYMFPGREGFSAKPMFEATSLPKRAEDLIHVMKEKNIKLIVIGPEAELAEGWADVFRTHGFLVFGPSKKAAQLESSKIFAKEFMKRAGIPTARYKEVQSVSQTMEQAKHFNPPYVLKADGLAGGKGVFICHSLEELKKNAQKIFEEKIFKNCSKSLLEEFQTGPEISVFALTNGEDYRVLPLAQDYKKLKNKGEGPNTGGMGALAPISLPPKLWNPIQNQILNPTIQQLKKENLFYRGVLYFGLILTEQGPQVLEYNVRFGDPETQALLPLLDMDIGKLFYETACGNILDLKFKNIFSCCVVLADPGYPNSIEKGTVIQGMDSYQEQTTAYFLYAGAKKSKTEWLVDGGRTLNAVGLGSSKIIAIQSAYNLAKKISSLYFRDDIGS